MGNADRFARVWETVDAAMKSAGPERHLLMDEALRLWREAGRPCAEGAATEPSPPDPPASA